MSRLLSIFASLTILSSTSGRIFNVRSSSVQNCNITNHPYFVGIYKNQPGNVICGGSILSPWWVLSGGSCCEANPKTHGVITGMQYIGGKFDQNVTFELVYKFHRQSQASAPFDVCMFKLSSKLKLNNRTNLISIADKPMAYDQATLLSYTNGPPNAIQDLQCSKMAILPTEVCMHKVPNIGSNGYCLQDLMEGPMCQGDEGSPVLAGSLQICVFVNRQDQQLCTDNKVQVCVRFDQDIRKFYRSKNVQTLTRAVDGHGFLDGSYAVRHGLDCILVLLLTFVYVFH